MKRLAIILMSFSLACSAVAKGDAPKTSTGRFVGYVIDRTTGQHVPNAWVKATYVLGAGEITHGGQCIRQEVVRADANGSFSLPYYRGYPPLFYSAFAHRYKWGLPPQDTAPDGHGHYVIKKYKDGKLQSTEGSYDTNVDAMIAARLLFDVYVEPFNGTDDEWIRLMERYDDHYDPGCLSIDSKGGLDWTTAKIDEVERAPDLDAKRLVLQRLREAYKQEEHLIKRIQDEQLTNRVRAK